MRGRGCLFPGIGRREPTLTGREAVCSGQSATDGTSDYDVEAPMTDGSGARQQVTRSDSNPRMM